MTTIWKLIDIQFGGDNFARIRIQEVIDGVAGKIYTSALINKNAPASLFLSDLRTKIKADRDYITAQETIETKIDLTDFESSIPT